MPSFIHVKQYSFLTALSVVMIVLIMAFVTKESEQPDKHLEVVLRTIGHRVLLHSKDSTSRVMPIRAVDGSTYRISFESSFGFIPDTLMRIVDQELAKTGDRGSYTVRVVACGAKQAVFAYEVNPALGDLRACRQRGLKKGCYAVEISFPEERSFAGRWLWLALIPVLLAWVYVARRRAPVSKPAEAIPTDNLPLDYTVVGSFRFFESKGALERNGETIELSVKEAKALSLLIANQNEVVGRDRLMKEIWEDDGVFVMARNVDVLVSKLRKKLSADPNVKIVNVHGKGYRMIV